MSEMTDTLLVTIAAWAKSEEAIRVPITVLVGGTLVTGSVMSADTWFQHNPISKQFIEAVERLEAEGEGVEGRDEEGGEVSQDLPNFIHLSDAHYMVAGQLVPTDEGIPVRIKIADISAYNFGTISRD